MEKKEVGMKKQSRAAKAVLWTLIVILTAIAVFLGVWWFGFTFPAFDSIAEREQRIPGLDSGLSPQGLCALPDGGPYAFAMSGYISGEPSRVYLIPADHVASDIKQAEHFVTFTEGGKDVETHFGGVACSESYMYIASGKKVIRISLGKILAANNGAAVEIDDFFETDLRSNAYCYIFDGVLYVGEFYRPGNYETDPSHHMDVGGTTNHALVYAYPMDEEKTGGVADMVPSKVISVCDEVQGIALDGQAIYLSCSYGLPASRLKIYENRLGAETAETFTVGGKQVPLYQLAERSADLTMPCMSEEICLKDGKLYILFESMSKQYRWVVHNRISVLMSIGDPFALRTKD